MTGASLSIKDEGQLASAWAPHCHQRPSEHDAKAPRIAVVLRGESFQDSLDRPQGSTELLAQAGALASHKQLLASQSQLKYVVEPFERLGLPTDVFSATYATPFTPELTKFWGDRLRSSTISARPGSQGLNAWDAVSLVLEHVHTHRVFYRFVVVLRHDLLLKRDVPGLMQQKADAHEQLWLPFHASSAIHGLLKPDQPAADTLQVIPGHLFGCFADALDHGKWWPGTRMERTLADAVGDDHLGFLLDLRADAYLLQASNSLYAFAGRIESAAPDSPLPQSGARRPLMRSSQVELSIILALTVGAVLTAVFGKHITEYLPRNALAGFACAVYVAISLTIDLSIAVQANVDSPTSKYTFEPACAVVLTEAIKLVASACLYAGNRAFLTTAPATLGLDDVRYLCLPALCFTLNNVLVWWAIASNDAATFGVFRDTMILWTACLWVCVFKTSLGFLRMLGIGVVFLGLVVNRMGAFSVQHAWSWGVLWVLGMTLCNALGSVFNEFAIKRNHGLDINVQNMVLYTACLLGTLVLIGVSGSRERLSNPATFFQGFTQHTFFTVSLQAFAGLAVSRILKYADSVAKTVATCFRGPLLVFVAPMFVRSSHDKVTFLSAFIVASGCMGYLSQGPLAWVPNKNAGKREVPVQR